MLGDRDIHVDVRYDYSLQKLSISQSVCIVTGTDASASEAETARLHASCDQNPTRLELSLLRVSKQIHREAALLPFLLNRFLFSKPSSLASFANQLLTVQKMAVTSIDLRSRVSEPIRHEEKLRIAKLRGLRSVSLSVAPMLLGQQEVPSVLEVRRHLEKVTQLFEHCTFSVAKVNIVAGTRHALVAADVVLPGEYHEMAREVEDGWIGRAAEDSVGTTI